MGQPARLKAVLSPSLAPPASAGPPSCRTLGIHAPCGDEKNLVRGQARAGCELNLGAVAEAGALRGHSVRKGPRVKPSGGRGCGEGLGPHHADMVTINEDRPRRGPTPVRHAWQGARDFPQPDLGRGCIGRGDALGAGLEGGSTCCRSQVDRPTIHCWLCPCGLPSSGGRLTGFS